MPSFYAVIGNIGYEKAEAINESEAHRKLTVKMIERGASGLLKRWLASGAKIEKFKRKTPDKEERQNGNN